MQGPPGSLCSPQTHGFPKTTTSLGTHILRFSPNFSSIFSSHRRSIMEHVNSVFPFLYNQSPISFSNTIVFQVSLLSTSLTFYFHFNISCHPDINRWAGTMQYPPSALPAPPPPLSSHTPVLSSASLPASWHSLVVPEMLRADQKKKVLLR